MFLLIRLMLFCHHKHINISNIDHEQNKTQNTTFFKLLINNPNQTFSRSTKFVICAVFMYCVTGLPVDKVQTQKVHTRRTFCGPSYSST